MSIPQTFLRDEIPMNEVYVKGLRHKAKGTWAKMKLLISPEPCALCLAYRRFPTASSETWTFLAISCKTTKYFVINTNPAGSRTKKQLSWPCGHSQLSDRKIATFKQMEGRF